MGLSRLRIRSSEATAAARRPEAPVSTRCRRFSVAGGAVGLDYLTFDAAPRRHGQAIGGGPRPHSGGVDAVESRPAGPRRCGATTAAPLRGLSGSSPGASSASADSGASAADSPASASSSAEAARPISGCSASFSPDTGSGCTSTGSSSADSSSGDWSSSDSSSAASADARLCCTLGVAFSRRPAPPGCSPGKPEPPPPTGCGAPAVVPCQRRGSR